MCSQVFLEPIKHVLQGFLMTSNFPQKACPSGVSTKVQIVRREH